MLTAILLGFVLGLRHASDPDHVIAVSTIVARHRRASAVTWIGVAWGVGHSATILAVGSAIVALRLAVPARTALGLELLVGFVLIALGVASPRASGDDLPAHLHEGGHGLRTPILRSACVGLVHGLAGSAGAALLALAAMPTIPAELAYLAVFCLGTIGGMVAISLVLGLPLGFAAQIPGAHRWIVAGSRALSLAFGVWIVYDICFVQGLL
jgi:hypothetical protein